jgi:nucleoporin SEH1
MNLWDVERLASNRTVLTSAGNDGKVRLWRSTYGNVWRPMGSLDVVQGDDAPVGGDAVMEE